MGSIELSEDFMEGVRELIVGKKWEAARSISSTAALLFWKIGERARGENPDDPEGYGEKAIRSMGARFPMEFGKGFDEANIRRMVQFHEAFPDESHVASLAEQLSWSHFVLLIPLRDEQQRNFYAQTCQQERWSVRTLQRQIGGMLYERVTYSLDPAGSLERELAALRGESGWTPDLVFRDPHHLDFLGIASPKTDQALESAILGELEAFLMESGSDFCLVARRKRIVVDGLDFFLELLFYHRKLRSAVAVELKTGEFKAVDEARVARGLRWLEENDRKEGENPPLGLILCP
ncbi:MAG: DUF1016 domain-containing protein, partial [Desulfobacterales bacterium]|nr:DUF1016 domain-containing protein [Desulfobacterales bacterium]